MGSKTTFPAQPMSSAGVVRRGSTAAPGHGQGNNVKLPTSRTYAQILRENILTVIHLILFALSGVLILLGRPLDAITTVAVISFNILVGVIQEIRAKHALDRIALLSRPSATVIRAGQEQMVDPSALVVGDLLVAATGRPDRGRRTPGRPGMDRCR